MALKLCSAVLWIQRAQRAGEGAITYMRTDGLSISQDAVEAIRAAISAEHGQQSLHPEPRVYKCLPTLPKLSWRHLSHMPTAQQAALP